MSALAAVALSYVVEMCLFMVWPLVLSGLAVGAVRCYWRLMLVDVIDLLQLGMRGRFVTD